MADDQILSQEIIVKSNLGQVLKIWWWLTWRLFLTLLAIVFVMSFIGTTLFRLYQLDYQNAISTYGGGLLFHLSAFYFVRQLFTRGKFKDFSIVLVATKRKPEELI